jgi:hypothetical protein
MKKQKGALNEIYVLLHGLRLFLYLFKYQPEMIH